MELDMVKIAYQGRRDFNILLFFLQRNRKRNSRVESPTGCWGIPLKTNVK
jgi:hypothetical protein